MRVFPWPPFAACRNGRRGKGFPCIFLLHRGFRLCGGDQRAFRSPFGNLRPHAADGIFHRKRIFCGRRGKGFPCIFPASQRVSPLRRRPKGFPIAFWKPSAPCSGRDFPQKTDFLWKTRERLPLHFFASQRVSPLRRRPGGFSIAPWPHLGGAAIRFRKPLLCLMCSKQFFDFPKRITETVANLPPAQPPLFSISYALHMSRDSSLFRFTMKSCALVTIPRAERLPRSLSLFTVNSEISTQ